MIKHLKNSLVLSCLLLYASDSLAETNDLRAAKLLFDVPIPQLRMLTTSPELKRPEVSPDHAPALKLEVKPRESLETRLTSTNWASFAQSTVAEQEFYSIYDRLDRSGYFERIPANSDSSFIRWAKAPFEPEVEHLGRTTVGGSLLTAIKRKNPFCLLKIDELLSISW